MSEFAVLYKSKLSAPADAVGRIASGVTLSMGMAMTEPPALLKALADRAAGKVDDLKIYYCESTSIAGKTILRYELTDRDQPRFEQKAFVRGNKRVVLRIWKMPTKNFGDAHRVPFVVACCRCLVLLAALLLCFLFGCHGSILPFHSSWNFATVFCCN